MQSTSSVAQGSFLFLPEGFSLAKLRCSKRKKLDEPPQEKWETTFKNIWDAVDSEVKDIHKKLFGSVLEDLMKHMKTLHGEAKLSEGVIPCEILITGTNLPDHKLLFSTFAQSIHQEVSPYSASLLSWNCGNIKSTVQNFVSQIIPIGKHRKKGGDDESGESSDDNLDCNNEGEEIVNDERGSSRKVYFQASQYNLSTLSSWYGGERKDESETRPVVVIVHDFESFPPSVLGEFILLLSAYSSRIPFILVFGVATTPVSVYQSLPPKVLAQLAIKLFRSEPSTSLLNDIVDNVMFSERCPFRLGSKCMTFLTDIFLFHSFSVRGFVQGYKFCLMEHLYRRNHYALCCSSERVEDEAKALSADELESLRKLASFQKFVEDSPKDERKALLVEDESTKATVARLTKDVFDHTKRFHVALKCLHILTRDLPKNPLGRTVRECYCRAVSTHVSQCQEYKECVKLLELQSRSELAAKMKDVIAVMESRSEDVFREAVTKMKEFAESFDNVGKSSSQDCEKKPEDEYATLRKGFVEYVDGEFVAELLRPPASLPLHEVAYFDDLPAVRRRISGAPRGAIHLALNDPRCYLNCKCCELPSPGAVVPTMPDLSVAYKIHLECGKIINMYDWLQSFAASVKSAESKDGGDDDDGDVDQEIQARFTRAVSELQFLGFIKPSRAKTDHVSRLTW